MIRQATPDAIDAAARLLQTGDVVAMPTETVYGLAADATNADAVAKIYALKQRPSFNPLICHVADVNAAGRLVELDDRARALAAIFWPGPLTLVLPARPDNKIAENVSAGLPTLAVRVPAHPVALSLLQRCDRPLAAPSANRSGSVSPTTALHVAQSFSTAAPFILAGGSTHVGLESTILDLSGNVPLLLRPGSVTQDAIESVIGPVTLKDTHGTITAPGQLARHYATTTPLRLNAVDVKDNEALLAFGSVKFIGVAGYGFVKDMPPALYRNLSAHGDLDEAATHLFGHMRELDAACQAQGVISIAVMAIPSHGVGIAINDRLQRAATPA